jgi:hypothetical protein
MSRLLSLSSKPILITSNTKMEHGVNLMRANSGIIENIWMLNYMTRLKLFRNLSHNSLTYNSRWAFLNLIFWPSITFFPSHNHLTHSLTIAIVLFPLNLGPSYVLTQYLSMCMWKTKASTSIQESHCWGLWERGML